MTPYAPSSRRPIADVFRKTAHAAVRLCVALGIHPNTVSVLSLVAAIGAAVSLFYWQSANWLLLLSAALMVLRLWFNMLDGMVAIESGQASALGELYNEIPDRLSDFAIFAGVAHSGLAKMPLAYTGAACALFVAYIGTFGQALDVGRQFGGVMSKQWRMVALAGAAVATFFAGSDRGVEVPRIGLVTLFDLVLLVILIGCVQTVWIRLRAIRSGLLQKAADQEFD